MRLLLVLCVITICASCATTTPVKPEPKFKTEWLHSDLEPKLDQIFRRGCKLKADQAKRAERLRGNAERAENPWLNLLPRKDRQVYSDALYLCMLGLGYTPIEKCIKNCNLEN